MDLGWSLALDGQVSDDSEDGAEARAEPSVAEESTSGWAAVLGEEAAKEARWIIVTCQV